MKAKPANLPSEISLNASGLKTLEDKLTFADLKLPEEVEFAKEIDAEQVIVSVYDPVAEAEARKAAEEAEAAAAAAEAAEAEGEASEESSEATEAESAEPAEAAEGSEEKAE